MIVGKLTTTNIYKDFIGPSMFVYFPGNRFPSLSVTGNYCALRCKHCMGHYLQHMVPVPTPQRLVEFVNKNKERINGFLLSGGCLPSGKVPLKNFASVVREIRETTELLINVHTGLIDEEDMGYLKYMDPHHISIDIIGSTETVRNVIGIPRSREDYFHALQLLDSSGLSYSPHVIIGLDFGKIKGEKDAIDYISHLKNFSNLVLIVLIPTPGTPMENVKVEEEDVIGMLYYAAEKIEPGKIVLGCMRPRKMLNIEKVAVELGFRGIVLPSLRTMRYIRERNIKVETRETCCVF